MQWSWCLLAYSNTQKGLSETLPIKQEGFQTGTYNLIDCIANYLCGCGDMVTRVTELPTFLPVKGGLSLSLKPGLNTMVTLLIYLFFVF